MLETLNHKILDALLNQTGDAYRNLAYMRDIQQTKTNTLPGATH